MTTQSQMDSPRDKWQAVKRGFMGKCPHCGEGKMFRAFLKVAEACPSCGEELHHQRADDAPPYMTIFVVGHIIGAGMLWVEHQDDQLPIWIHATIWPILTVVLELSDTMTCIRAPPLDLPKSNIFAEFVTGALS